MAGISRKKKLIKALQGLGLTIKEAYELSDAKRVNDLPGELRDYPEIKSIFRRKRRV